MKALLESCQTTILFLSYLLLWGIFAPFRNEIFVLITVASLLIVGHFIPFCDLYFL